MKERGAESLPESVDYIGGLTVMRPQNANHKMYDGSSGGGKLDVSGHYLNNFGLLCFICKQDLLRCGGCVGKMVEMA